MVHAPGRAVAAQDLAAGEHVGQPAGKLAGATALAAAAAVTKKVRLCTGITLVAQRDPIITAKTVASLDLVSGGRMLLGVGAAVSVSRGIGERRREFS